MLLLSAGGVMAQTTALKGKVTGPDKQGIPFAIVQVKGQQKGAYCDENGAFSLDLGKSIPCILLAQCLGYVTTEILVERADDSVVIELLPKPTDLKDVVVKANHGKRRTGIIGKKNIKPFGWTFYRVGYMQAIFLQGDPAKKGFLKDVYIFITDLGIPTTKFRVHIYGIDTVNMLPGDDLIDSNIIVHATKGNEWLVVDLKAMRVPIGKGIFVGIEWIDHPGNDLSTQTVGDHKFQGMVPALTKGYGGSMLSYSSDPYSNTWAWDRNTMGGVLNSAIYASYYYYK